VKGRNARIFDMLNGVKVEMEGSGHCPHMDNSKKLASIIDEEFKLYL
jgi:pimeloyl-ACP methyl ester carboxylesterase